MESDNTDLAGGATAWTAATTVSRLWSFLESFMREGNPSDYRNGFLILTFLRGFSNGDAWGPIAEAANHLVLGEEVLTPAIAATLTTLDENDGENSFCEFFAASPLGEMKISRIVRELSGVPTEHIDADVLVGLLVRFLAAEGPDERVPYVPSPVTDIVVGLLDVSGDDVVVYDPCAGYGDVLSALAPSLGEGSALVGETLDADAEIFRRMRFALAGIPAEVSLGDAVACDAFGDLSADIVASVIPFNRTVWGDRDRNRAVTDPRLAYGVPPVRSANFAWIQQALAHLAPEGVAAIVMSNSPLQSEVAAEKLIRKAMIDADIIEAVVSLPGRLFCNTTTPVSVVVFAGKSVSEEKAARKRAGEILFINAQELGEENENLVRTLPSKVVSRILDTYHSWVAEGDDYKDVEDFCLSATIDSVERHDFTLAPWVYATEAETTEDDADAAFKDTFADMLDRIAAERVLGEELDAVLAHRLEAIRDELFR